jgi:hypothetical protein
MAKMIKKGDLPSKVCAVCGLAFAWRKKWARDWDQVKFCSDRCRPTRGTHPSLVPGNGVARADNR